VPSNGLDPEYLCDVLTAFNDDLLRLVERSTHDTRKLETTKLLAFRVPVLEKAEQQKIVRHFNDLRMKIANLASEQCALDSKFEALKASVLDETFEKCYL